MEANLAYNKLSIRDNSVSVNIPDNDIAKLMFYLKCVSNVLKYNGFGQYTNYNNYYSLSNQEIKTLIKLATIFNPEVMMDVGVFVKNEDLDKGNKFIEITDEEMNIHANREVLIGGIKTKVLKMMLFKANWAISNYYLPKKRLTQRMIILQNQIVSPYPSNPPIPSYPPIPLYPPYPSNPPYPLYPPMPLNPPYLPPPPIPPTDEEELCCCTIF